MADYMQDDAMRRVAQMYSKTYRTQDDATIHNQNVENTPSKENKVEKSDGSVNHHSKNFLDIFMQDKEKSLIVLLIVILLSEKADTSVILALMYLII